MDRNLALELVRVTEAAALVSSKFMGRGDKNGADGAAVEAMRRAFESVKIKGEVVIGEGEIDEAPMLYIGEKVGSQEEGTMEVDIAVDPLDGTELIAKGLPNAIAVIAMGKKGSLLNAPDTYMKKIIVGPKAKGVIDLDKSVEENIIDVSKALVKKTTPVSYTHLLFCFIIKSVYKSKKYAIRRIKMKIGTIDIGTNSMRLLTAQYKDGKIIDRKKYVNTTRIGQGVDSNGYISKEAIDRNIQALKEFKGICDEYKCDYICCMGTSALRDSKNSKEFVEYVYKRQIHS